MIKVKKIGPFIVMAMLIPFNHFGQTSESRAEIQRIDVSYHHFTMLSGDSDFKRLESYIPEIIGFNFMKSKIINWIENPQDLEYRMADQQSSYKSKNINIKKDPNALNETDKATAPDYFIEGNFSEFNGRVDIYTRIYDPMNYAYYKLATKSGDVNDLHSIIEGLSITIEERIKELSGFGRGFKTIGIICFEAEGLIFKKKLEGFSEELTISLTNQLDRTEFLDFLPFDYTSDFCGRSVNYNEIFDNLAADAIISGKLRETDNRNISIEPYIWLSTDEQPIYLNSITGRTYNYFKLKDYLLEEINDALNSIIDSRGNWNHEIIDFSPDEPEGYLQMASEYYNKGEFENAIFLFNKALAIEPASAEVLSKIGVIKSEQGKTDQAIYYTQKALEINDGYEEAYFTLGNSLLNKGDYEEALDVFNTLLELNPNIENIHLLIGLTNLYLGDYKLAISEFQQELEKDPDDIEALKFSGQCNSYLGDYEKAKAIYYRVLEIDPDDLSTRSLLNRIYIDQGIDLFRQGDYIAALYAFYEAREISNDISTNEYIRITLNRVPDFDRVAGVIENGIEEGVYNIKEVYYNQGYDLYTMFFESKNMIYAEQAMYYFRKHIEVSSDNKADALFAIGIMYDFRNRNQEAIEHYDAAYAITEETGETSLQLHILNNLGYQYYRLQDYDRSIEYYKAVLDINAAYLLTYYILIRRYMLTNSLSEAQEYQSVLNGYLKDNRSLNQEINSGDWFFHTEVEPVLLHNAAQKKYFAFMEMALLFHLLDQKSESSHYMKSALNTYTDKDKEIERLIQFDLNNLLEKQPQYRNKIEEFRSELTTID